MCSSAFFATPAPRYSVSLPLLSPYLVPFVKTAMTDAFLDFLPASFKNLETPRTKFSSKFWSKADRYRRIGKSVLLSPYLEFRFLANFDKHGFPILDPL